MPAGYGGVVENSLLHCRFPSKFVCVFSKRRNAACSTKSIIFFGHNMDPYGLENDFRGAPPIFSTWEFDEETFLSSRASSAVTSKR